MISCCNCCSCFRGSAALPAGYARNSGAPRHRPSAGLPCRYLPDQYLCLRQASAPSGRLPDRRRALRLRALIGAQTPAGRLERAVGIACGQTQSADGSPRRVLAVAAGRPWLIPPAPARTTVAASLLVAGARVQRGHDDQRWLDRSVLRGPPVRSPAFRAHRQLSIDPVHAPAGSAGHSGSLRATGGEGLASRLRATCKRGIRPRVPPGPGPAARWNRPFIVGFCAPHRACSETKPAPVSPLARTLSLAEHAPDKKAGRSWRVCRPRLCRGGGRPPLSGACAIWAGGQVRLKPMQVSNASALFSLAHASNGRP